MQHLAPESEPRAAGALVEFLRRQVGVDDRLDAAARRVRERESRPHALPHASGQGTEARRQQAVLVAKVMRDQPGRNIGATGNLRQRAADVADLRQTVDGDFDQLSPAAFFQLVPRRDHGR